MDWLDILNPIIGIVLTTATTWALIWLRKYLQAKYDITISDEDFAVAKRVVKSIEEKALSGQLTGSKKVAAIADLKEARPNMDDASVVQKIDQAVAVEPTVGATSVFKCDPGLPG